MFNWFEQRSCGLEAGRHRRLVTGTGLTALDRIYARGRERPLEALGGSCANVLVSLAMLGHRVAPVVVLGDDSRGDYLEHEFRRAGCETRFVFRKRGETSPVIVEHVDPQMAQHWFTFTCPETSAIFPRWKPIDDEEAESARATFEDASVFYVDRLSPAILTAMESARDAGAIVFFEPPTLASNQLFDRALRLATILKLSDQTAGTGRPGGEDSAARIVIRTHGSQGLTASCDGTLRFFPSCLAPRMVDTCGAGDMLTTGLLDYLLRCWSAKTSWTIDDVFVGIETGQRLAALNCAFAGARGVFHALGGRRLRLGLDAGLEESFVALTMAFGPFDGY